jgi:hypothetical protein
MLSCYRVNEWINEWSRGAVSAKTVNAKRHMASSIFGGDRLKEVGYSSGATYGDIWKRRSYSCSCSCRCRCRCCCCCSIADRELAVCGGRRRMNSRREKRTRLSIKRQYCLPGARLPGIDGTGTALDCLGLPGTARGGLRAWKNPETKFTSEQGRLLWERSTENTRDHFKLCQSATFPGKGWHLKKAEANEHLRPRPIVPSRHHHHAP